MHALASHGRRPTPGSYSHTTCTRAAAVLASSALQPRAAASTGRGRVRERRRPTPAPRRPARRAASEPQGGGLPEELRRHRPWASRAEQQRQAARQGLARESLAEAAALMAEPDDLAGPGLPRPQPLLASFLRGSRWREVMSLVACTGDAGRPLYWPALKPGDVVSPALCGPETLDWVAMRQGPRAFARLLCRYRLSAASGQPLSSLSLGGAVFVLRASVARWVELLKPKQAPQLRALVPVPTQIIGSPAAAHAARAPGAGHKRGPPATVKLLAPPSRRRPSKRELQQLVGRTAKQSQASTLGKTVRDQSGVTRTWQPAWGSVKSSRTEKGGVLASVPQSRAESGSSRKHGKQRSAKWADIAPTRQAASLTPAHWLGPSASTKLDPAISTKLLRKFGDRRGKKAGDKRAPAGGGAAKARGKAKKPIGSSGGQSVADRGSSAPGPAYYTVVSDGSELGGRQEWGSSEVVPALPPQTEAPHRVSGSPGQGSAASTGFRSRSKRGQEAAQAQGGKAASRKGGKAGRKENKGPKRPRIGTWGRSGRQW